MTYRLLAALVRRYLNWRGGTASSPALFEQPGLPPDTASADTVERDLTIMYCGIRRYPFVAARYQDDLQSLALLTSRFMAAMTEEVHRHGGTVDKFLDGRFLAFWNAPLRVEDHPAQACRAALAMRRALPALNRELAAMLPPLDKVLPLEMAIAIDTGLCAVGRIGSAKWSDYTAVGFPVRQAGLLERRARLAGKDILVTDSVVGAVTGFDFREVALDFPQLRGGGPKVAYELPAAPDNAS